MKDSVICINALLKPTSHNLLEAPWIKRKIRIRTQPKKKLFNLQILGFLPLRVDQEAHFKQRLAQT
jgi:hypothetical protein